MQEISLEEIKKIELELLSYVDSVCKKENIRYFLCGGTLLGAVRHKGFIPWDDDIDIVMPRPDYERLIDLLDNNENYKLFSARDDNYYYNFGKLADKRTCLTESGIREIEGMGVHIDIFPMDGMPEDEKECKSHFRMLDRQRHRITAFSMLRPRIRKNVVCYIRNYCKFLATQNRSLQDEQKKYLNNALKYSYDDASRVFISGGAYKQKDIIPKIWFRDCVLLEFEGKQFAVPSDYGQYLRQLYGDYMQLPPVEARVPHHNFVAQYREKF